MGDMSFASLIDSLNPQIAGAAKTSADFNQIGNLAPSYWKGLEQAYTQGQRDVFKNGIPTNPDGSYDMRSIINNLARVQGAQALPGIMQQAKLEYNQKQDSLNNPPIQPQNNAPPNTSPGVVNQTAAPINQPQTPNSPRWVSPAEGERTGIYGPPPADPNNPDAPQPRVAQTQPAPAQSAPIQPTPVQTQTITPGQPAGNPALNNLIPPQFMQQFGEKAPAAYMGILQRAISGGMLDEATAKNYQSKIDAIQKALVSQGELTPAQKEYQDAVRNGFRGTPDQWLAQKAQDEARAKTQGEQFAKRYESINELGNKAEMEIPKITVAQRLMNDPNFYSGFGAKYDLALKRIAVALGADVSKATPQEAFNKVVSDSILNGLGMLKGLGQIRVAEINLAKEAAASADNTPASNRMLLEIQKRTNQAASDVAELARKYKNGNLDSGFDNVVNGYYKSKPLFSDAELKNPKLLTLPRGVSQDQAAKLPKGSYFYDINGTLRQKP